jgi:hypothetical protein
LFEIWVHKFFFTLLSLGSAEDGRLEQLGEAISIHLDIKDLFNCAKDIDVKDAYILGAKG